MKPAHRELLIVVVCLLLGFVISNTILTHTPDSKYIDCSLSEISPDFTTDMKNQCRKLKSNGSVEFSR